MNEAKDKRQFERAGRRKKEPKEQTLEHKIPIGWLTYGGGPQPQMFEVRENYRPGCLVKVFATP